MNTPMTLDEAAEFLDRVSRGLISGRISEWPGLREACGVAHAAIAARGEAVGYLITWNDPTYRGPQTLSFDKCDPEDGKCEQVYTQPPAPKVDEAMVERGCEASWPVAKSSMESADWNEIGRPRREHHKRVVRAALHAALQAALEVPND